MRNFLLSLTIIIMLLMITVGGLFLLSELHPLLPSSQFYRLQLAAESVRLTVTFDETKKADLALDHAERRLNEFARTFNGDHWEPAAEQLNVDLDLAIRLILEAPVEKRTRLFTRLNRLLDMVEQLVGLMTDSIRKNTVTISLMQKVVDLQNANTPRKMSAIIEPQKSRVTTIDSENVPFLDQSFDHNFFQLSGGHGQSDCLDCHFDGQYAGTPRLCISCHLPPTDHLPGECENCHVSLSWSSVTYEHSGVEECQLCHSAETPINHYGGDCSRCHGVNAWSDYTFDHSGFIDCQICHTTDPQNIHYPGQCSLCHSVVNWEELSFDHIGVTDCAGCHNNDLPAFHYPGECSSCHVVEDWTVTTFNHSGFTDCTSCHARPANHFQGQCSLCHNTGNWQQINFNHEGLTECASCHSRPANHYQGQCSQCHSTNSWGDATFNHDGQADCQACHARPSDHYQGQCSQCHSTEKWGGAKFNHTGLTDCTSCHSRPDNHYQGQCSQCHSTEKWGGAKFNHDSQTDCKSCHSPPKEDDDDNHIPPVGQCSQCHNRKSWDT